MSLDYGTKFHCVRQVEGVEGDYTECKSFSRSGMMFVLPKNVNRQRQHGIRILRGLGEIETIEFVNRAYGRST